MVRVRHRPDYLSLSSPAKAGDPVFQSTCDRTAKPRRTGYPAFAGYDGSGGGRTYGEANRKQKCEAAWPLERSIPEFPTKVGGHHVTGSTDPARDSSLKDR